MAPKTQTLAALGAFAAGSAAFVAAPGSKPVRREANAPQQQLRANAAVSQGANAGALPLTVIGAALGSAAAVASLRRGRPQGCSSRSVVPLRASAKDCIAGTGGPFPENYWDPAGISTNKTEEEILELRAIELKHGRVAMLAVLGWFHHIGGLHYIGDAAVGTQLSNDPLVAIQQLPMGGVWQVVFTILCLEWLVTYVAPPPKQKPWDILGWSDILATWDNPEWKRAEQQELNNGRLAMLAFVGLVAQDLAFGDYGPHISEFCGGSSLCRGLEDPRDGPPIMLEMIPPTPYKYPPLYPAKPGMFPV